MDQHHHIFWCRALWYIQGQHAIECCRKSQVRVGLRHVRCRFLISVLTLSQYNSLGRTRRRPSIRLHKRRSLSSSLAWWTFSWPTVTVIPEKYTNSSKSKWSHTSHYLDTTNIHCPIQMQRGCNIAQSDTFKYVNQFMDKYLNSGTGPVQCDTRTMGKTSCGLNHPQIGWLIILAEYIANWDDNSEWSILRFFIFILWCHICSLKAYFNSGCYQIMGYSMPVLLYEEYKYDPEDPNKGLFQSAFLVCVSEYMHD